MRERQVPTTELTRDRLLAEGRALFFRFEEWFAALSLPARWAALVGAAGGGVVGLWMVRSMWRHAVFTGPQQNLTAGAVLLALWLCIGAIGGLTVLAPLGETMNDE
jgi:hypothetical protein